MASVYVRGFHKKLGERDLEKIFAEIGPISDVRIVRDFAFIVNTTINRSSKTSSQANKQSKKCMANQLMVKPSESNSLEKSLDQSQKIYAENVEEKGTGIF